MHLYGAIHSEAGPVLDLQQEVGAQRPDCRTWPEFPDRLRLCKSRCLAALAAVLDQDQDQDIQYCTLYSTRQPANLRLEYVQAAISRPRRCACFTCFDLFSPQIRFLSQIYGPGPGGIILFLLVTMPTRPRPSSSSTCSFSVCICLTLGQEC